MALGRRREAGARNEVCLAAEELHAVGGEEVEVLAVSEDREVGGRIRFHLRMGEDEFSAYLIGPGAAEDLVLVGDDRVGGVEAEDLGSFGGKRVYLGAFEGGFIFIDGRLDDGGAEGFGCGLGRLKGRGGALTTAGRTNWAMLGGEI